MMTVKATNSYEAAAGNLVVMVDMHVQGWPRWHVESTALIECGWFVLTQW